MRPSGCYGRATGPIHRRRRARSRTTPICSTCCWSGRPTTGPGARSWSTTLPRSMDSAPDAAAFQVAVGETAEFSKTITETDLALFAALSGDFDPIHVDEAYARTTPFGRRIAHGILALALASTVSAMISRRARERGSRATPVSLGYDRIRFLKPVFVGDTLTELDPASGRTRSKVEVVKDDGEVAVAGEHIMKWLPEAR